MEITLKHHQQVRERIDSIGVYKDSSLSILIEISNSKCFDDSLNHLRLSWQSEMLQKVSHSFINWLPSKIDLANEMLPYLTCEIINISNKLADIGGIQSFQICMQKFGYLLRIFG